MGVLRHTVEQMAGVCPFVQILDDPVPHWRAAGLWTSLCPEQAIDEPKITLDKIQQRLVDRDLRQAQMAEQLVEAPTVLSPSLLQQQLAEQIPVRSGGLHGFRPGPFSAASSSLPRSADEAFEGFCSHFSPISKKVRSRAASAEMGSHQMADAGVAAHSSSSTPAAYELEQSSSSEEEEEDHWVDEYGRTWIMMAAFPGRWYLLGAGSDGEIWCDEPGG